MREETALRNRHRNGAHPRWAAVAYLGILGGFRVESVQSSILTILVGSSQRMHW